ncbi:preprotein translocase subunit SecA [Gemmata sp. SH-PL17]|uniref:preprotein translocase subunit SecA n=1 Tax=Gemmata sp. SH-PL17 TaxID=1630693 RepID=UPI00078EC7CC|nr:preprotein translocase subunit SecA [Gemmata sp. SH-PL17]AMV30450.1 preprotein translocase subunit SecA [Gemmata sp. SH-PL17]
MATAQAGLEPTIFERLGDRFNAFVEGCVRAISRMLGGSTDERRIKSIGYVRPRNAETHTVIPGSALARVNELEPKMQALTDDQLKALSTEFRDRLKKGATLDSILPEAFAACRESARRTKNMRHYDVQLLGGAVLHGYGTGLGSIAEMKTGEGKTLVATLAAYLNALDDRGVHVVTVNDYLARRDCEWMLPIYNALGVSAAYIQSDMDPETRRRAYECDITYGTASEFGFDYLRDNMKIARFDDEQYHPYYRQVQRAHHYAIIDEVDNILVDEARTPLIISGPAFSDAKRFAEADKVTRALTELERKARKELIAAGTVKAGGTEGDNLTILTPVDPAKVDPQNPPPKGVYFEIKEKERTCHLTDAGVRKAEELAGVESFYTAGNMEWPHLMDNALKAHHLYQLDRHYMIDRDQRENNELSIVIIDEHTGRAMYGRQWSDGLHQAVEAKHPKEGVQIKQETQTMATVTLQNFFKLYTKLAGMTGTAKTEETEFWKIYKLDVVAVPTNRPMRRIEHKDLVYRTDKEKWDAVVKEVVELSKTGRPILIGTKDVDRSEKLSQMLRRQGIKHELLNAKPENVGREAEIVAQAGRIGAVTISTNMAGRGTDIILGGNAETLAWARLKQLKDSDNRPLYPTRLEVPNDVWTSTVNEIESKEKMKEEGRKVAEMGGMHILGTERHDSRRIDNQLRGRAGRQGDPGSSRFYLSLQDELMRHFGGEWVGKVLTRLGMEEGEAIESGMVSRRIEGAQKKREEMHFDQRKNLLEYDEVMDLQRKRVYGARQEILDGKNPRLMILDMIRVQIAAANERFLADNYGAASFAEFASNRLGMEFEAGDFRTSSYEDASRQALEQAIANVPTFIQERLEENLNPDEEEKDWKWSELTRALNAKYDLKLTEKDLRKIGADKLAEALVQKAETAVKAVNLSDGERFLSRTYGANALAEWCRQKFGVKVTIEEIQPHSGEALTEYLYHKVLATYRQKDVEFPVRVAMQNFMADKPAAGQQRYDRDGLAQWATRRLGTVLATRKHGPNALADQAGFFAAADKSLEEEGWTDEFLRTEPRSRLREKLTEIAPKAMPTADVSEIDKQLESIYTGAKVAEQEDAKELTDWAQRELSLALDPARIVGKTQDEARHGILNAYDEKYRPEMHSVERSLVLEQIDSAWKTHLLVMDNLRSGVGLAGYAQEDPKIVYKREGMQEFDKMWAGLRDRTTESVFRMEEMGDEEAQAALWAGARATHAAAISASQARQAQADASEQQTNAGGEGKKVEPIRNEGKKVGRNDPCPCGSGKKYKNCHMKMEAGKK